VRRRNFIPADRFPYTTVTGMTYDSGDYRRSLDAALELAGYDALRRRQRELRRQGRYLGIGLSSYVEFCGLGPSRLLGGVGFGRGGWESATVRVHPGGKVTLYSGASDEGQGHATSFAQIAADGLGLPLEDVAVAESDTAQVQFGNATYNSRSMSVGGTAVKLAVDKVVAKALKIAAHLLEVAEEDVQFQDGRFSVKGAPHRVQSFAEVGLAANLAHNYPAGLEPGLEAQSFYDPVGLTASFGTHIAVVEVDIDTGRVRVERHIAVDDCGNVINPLLAVGQVHGGIAQGLGQALLEGAEYDEQGQLLTGSLADYALPRATDLPHLEVSHTVTPSPLNPLGVKGIGEAGTIGATPALVNAVLDALAPFGIAHLDMPLKPEKLWTAMQAARGALVQDQATSWEMAR
jgi:aerobic carbon-monoxide dehydrogenase large subunit